MNHKQSLLSLALLTVLAISQVPVFAEHTAVGGDASVSKQGKYHHKSGKHDKMKAAFQELNLTDAQKEQMKASHEAFRTENASQLAAMKTNHQKLRDLMKAKGADAKNDPEVQALKEQLKQDRQAIHQKREASMTSILTPEQQAKRAEIKARMKAEWQAKRQSHKENRQTNP